jgi:Fur family ferric uptake transcriptional regulator
MVKPREEEQFLDFLRARGLRSTAERRILIREIFAQHGHIDAASILGAVKARGLSISRATVYRNLELLVEAGLAHKVRLHGRRFLYEHLHAGQRHDHLACRQCGKLVEFVSPGITALLGEICRAHGFELRENQLQILGLCRGCAPGSAVAAAAPVREDRPHA